MKNYKLIFLLMIIIICIYFYTLKPQKLTWTSINVSNTIQGDAHLISKGNKHFLIDTGSHQEAKPYLIPYLKGNNIQHIEGVLITHPHFDHYGGLITILENNITVGNVYMNMPTKSQMKTEWWGGYITILYRLKNIVKHIIYLLSLSHKI